MNDPSDCECGAVLSEAGFFAGSTAAALGAVFSPATLDVAGAALCAATALAGGTTLVAAAAFAPAAISTGALRCTVFGGRQAVSLQTWKRTSMATFLVPDGAFACTTRGRLKLTVPS